MAGSLSTTQPSPIRVMRAHSAWRPVRASLCFRPPWNAQCRTPGFSLRQAGESQLETWAVLLLGLGGGVSADGEPGPAAITARCSRAAAAARPASAAAARARPVSSLGPRRVAVDSALFSATGRAGLGCAARDACRLRCVAARRLGLVLGGHWVAVGDRRCAAAACCRRRCAGPGCSCSCVASALYLPLLGTLRAVGSVGDALRRGRARDPVARRLDQPVVGAGPLVLVQADLHLLDRGAALERERHRLPARQQLAARRVGAALADVRVLDARAAARRTRRWRAAVEPRARRCSPRSCSRRCPTTRCSRTRRSPTCRASARWSRR